MMSLPQFGNVITTNCQSSYSIVPAPRIMKLMIQHVKQDETEANAHEEEETWKGYFYGLLLFITLGTQSILQNQYLGKMFELGMRARTILTAAIYKKSLTVPLSARRSTSTGEIVNLMSIDVQ